MVVYIHVFWIAFLWGTNLNWSHYSLKIHPICYFSLFMKESDIWCITESFLWVRRRWSFKASILIHYMDKSDSHHLICSFAFHGITSQGFRMTWEWRRFLYNVNGNMLKMHMYVIILWWYSTLALCNVDKLRKSLIFSIPPQNYITVP